jgi:hypothetical protein
MFFGVTAFLSQSVRKFIYQGNFCWVKVGGAIKFWMENSMLLTLDCGTSISFLYFHAVQYGHNSF